MAFIHIIHYTLYMFMDIVGYSSNCCFVVLGLSYLLFVQLDEIKNPHLPAMSAAFGGEVIVVIGGVVIA